MFKRVSGGSGAIMMLMLLGGCVPSVETHQSATAPIALLDGGFRIVPQDEKLLTDAEQAVVAALQARGQNVSSNGQYALQVGFAARRAKVSLNTQTSYGAEKKGLFGTCRSTQSDLTLATSDTKTGKFLQPITVSERRCPHAGNSSVQEMATRAISQLLGS